MSDETLDNILDNEEPAQEAPPAAEPEQPEPASEPDDGEKGEKSPEGDDPGEPPTPEVDEKPQEQQMVPIAALHQAKANARQFSEQIHNLQAQLQEMKAPPPPDQFDDPEGWQRHQDQKTQSTITSERMRMSEDMARIHFGDEAFDDAMEAVTEAAKSDPSIATEIAQSASPGLALMKKAENLKLQSEIGDPATYRERIRAEVLKEVQGTIDTSVTEQVKAALAKMLPTSLADDQTNAPRATANAAPEHQSISELLD